MADMIFSVDSLLAWSWRRLTLACTIMRDPRRASTAISRWSAWVVDHTADRLDPRAAGATEVDGEAFKV